MYAVLDVETTGLNPTRSHRVCEIAVIHVDRHGRIEREWCSLINPEQHRGTQRGRGLPQCRDTPPTTAQSLPVSDFSRAPTFGRLSGEVAKLLVGRLIVTHNPAFDLPALRHEFNLLGVEVPLRPELALSTMALAAQYIPLTGRPLHDSYPTAGASVDDAKEGDVKECNVKGNDVEATDGLALADARAAAELLTAYLSLTTEPPPWATLLDEVARLRWPSLAVEEAVRPATEC